MYSYITLILYPKITDDVNIIIIILSSGLQNKNEAYYLTLIINKDLDKKMTEQIQETEVHIKEGISGLTNPKLYCFMFQVYLEWKKILISIEIDWFAYWYNDRRGIKDTLS